MEKLEIYLHATATVDSDNEEIMEKARLITHGSSNERDKAVKLFYFVRDSIRYSAYMVSVFIEDFVASRVLEWGKGYCIQKAVLLTALARASGIPSRMAFAKIRNHRTPEKIVEMVGSNIFSRHAYNQFFIDGLWVSASATFDRKLCDNHGLTSVEFDGIHDAMLPSKDLHGNPYIEYLEKFGSWADLPFDWLYHTESKIVGVEKRSWLKPQK